MVEVLSHRINGSKSLDNYTQEWRMNNMEKQITEIMVYTKNGCPACNMTKAVLTGEEIEFNTINIDEVDDNGEPTKEAVEAREYIVEVLKLSQMPVVVVEGQEPFTGFRPDILHTLKK